MGTVMGNGRRGSRRRAGVLALMGMAPLMAGCGLIGGGSQPPLEEERTSWQHDAEAERWYVPAGVFTDRGIIETAFPELTPNVGL